MGILYLFCLVLSFLLRTFARKVTKYFCNMQVKTEELTNVGLQSYAKELSSQEQVKLKTFVALKFNKSYLTINDKFAGRRQFTPAELLAIQSIIANELWRK